MIGSRDLGDPVDGWQLGRVVDVDGLAVARDHFVDHGRRARDQVELVLALEPLLHDVHVQQAEEPAAEAEAERRRHLGLVVQRRVIQLELRRARRGTIRSRRNSPETVRRTRAA